MQKNTQNPSCPVCQYTNTILWTQSIDWEYFTSETLYAFYRCYRCETIYIDPVPKDQLAKIYPHNYYSFVEGKKSLTVKIKEYFDKRMFKKLLRDIAGAQINVLDIGGGTGWLLSVIKSLDSRVHVSQVVDIDPAARKEAEQQGHTYFQGGIEDFATDKKFHLILMLNLIEHVADPKSVMLKVQDILAEGGRVLLKTPNIESWDAYLFRKGYWGGLHSPRHWVLFSQRSFRRMLESTALSVQYFYYTQGAPFWSWSILVWLAKKKLVLLSKERPLIYHPLVPFLGAFFAGFDFIRGLFVKTSQMFIVLGKANN